MRNQRRYNVYILTHPSQRPLYAGITNSLDRRVFEHRNSLNQGCTARYKLNRLVYDEMFRDVRNAIAREKEIKGWGRARKMALVNATNPQWNDLAREWGRSIPPLSARNT